MWKPLAIICVLAGASAADGPHGGKPSCSPNPSHPLVEIDRIKLGNPEQQQKTVIEHGGNIAMLDVAGHPVAPGCVPQADLDRLAANLAKARWDVTRLQIKCMAFSPIHTEYHYNGKLVWNQRLCSGEELDKESAAVIDEIDHLLAALAPNRPKLN